MSYLYIGTYEGCGNTFTKEFWTQKIDPLAGLVLKPWYTRNFPDLAWSSSPDEMFTLIAIDIGNLYWHGVYTNIIGNDTSTAEVMLNCSCIGMEYTPISLAMIRPRQR